MFTESEELGPKSPVSVEVTAPPSRILLPRVFFALALVIGIAALEWWSKLDYSLGILYVFPVLIVSTVVDRWKVLVSAVACAWIRGQFVTGLSPIEHWLGFAMAVLAYGGVGLLVAEMSRNRRTLLAAYAKLKVEQELRHRAEDQLRMLAESSPAAIVTLNSRAEVLSANRAAHELLGFDEPNTLVGLRIDAHVPLFFQALGVSPGARPMRAAAASWARRKSGVPFPVATWFSTYGEGPQRCLAGIFVDTSEEVREREREAFRHFSDYNRLLAGAVSHEIRNLCSAIRVVTSNLGRRAELTSDADFRALTTLVESLAQIASVELRTSKQQAPAWIELKTLLEQLRLVVEPDWSDIGAEICWEIDAGQLPVQADEHGLLQVFLNLCQNSLRAVQQRPSPRLHIRTRKEVSRLVVSFIDSGPGIQDASALFQPFRQDANGAGLGLYVSRTLVRTFGGDVSYQPTDAGCRFDVTLLGSHGEP